MKSTKKAGNLSILQLSKNELDKFKVQGYLGPYSLFEEDQIQTYMKNIYSNTPNDLLPLYGRHTVIKKVAELAEHPQILNKVTSILGEDVIMWGSHMFKQSPGVTHPFHRDAEFTEIDGITVWLALKNVVSEGTFSVVSGSHLFKLSPQELKSQGVDTHNENALQEAAKAIDPESRLIRLDVKDGQFIIFHGLLWHGTRNLNTKERYSINFRYSTPSNKARIAKNGQLPNPVWYKNRPACLLVHGEDRFGINRVINKNRISKSRGIIKALVLNLPVRVFLNIKKKLRSKYY